MQAPSPSTTTHTLNSASRNRWLLRLYDYLLILIMAVLAACGLIYEYLLSHYAGYVLGGVETTIFIMIGLMIVAMGLGAFAARLCKNPFHAFLKLELAIAALGSTAILIIASFIALSHWFPIVLSETFLLPQDVMPSGGAFDAFRKATHLTPYIFGFLVGFLVGMEIPLIAQVREHLYQKHLANNTGTIYGADYIGAGCGAAIWVLIMLQMDITQAASITALTNLAAGLAFLFIFRKQIRFKWFFAAAHITIMVLCFVIFKNGYQWFTAMEDLLYKDQIVYSHASHYQRITITRRIVSPSLPPVYALYLNGRLQFSSEDEHIYHSYLVHPAMLAAARHDNILIIGGGDGLALRNVLQWQPKQVHLIDLDPQLVSLFNGDNTPADLSILPELNQHAFNQPNVSVQFGDAFVEIDTLITQKQKYDVIIVDLPDPNHPDLNKLYSTDFYARLKHLLNADGSMVIQSTSPYHAHRAFVSIGKTVHASGFTNTEQFHVNVPSFGEWGFTIATPFGQSPSQRIQNETFTLPSQEHWLTPQLLRASFEFPANFYQDYEAIKVNRLGTNTLYQYHYQAWKQQQGTLYDVFSQPKTTSEKSNTD